MADSYAPMPRVYRVVVLLFAMLCIARFATGAFVGGFPVTKRFGLTPGFDVYDDQMPETRGGLEITMPERPAPEVIAARTGANPGWVWRYIRWFHAPAQAVLASTPGVMADLAAHGLPQVRHWGRGVDTTVFHPHAAPDPALRALPGPVQLYVGRVAVEKNIEAFLASSHPGTRAVVGDGPARPSLARRFPNAHFLGPRFGADLAACYAAADVFVFPSRTDTFGLVMIEALACGTPVAAYPVTGPRDVLTPATGAMDDDLATAIAAALTRDRAVCASYGAGFGWPESARQFLDALAPVVPLGAAA